MSPKISEKWIEANILAPLQAAGISSIEKRRYEAGETLFDSPEDPNSSYIYVPLSRKACIVEEAMSRTGKIAYVALHSPGSLINIGRIFSETRNTQAQGTIYDFHPSPKVIGFTADVIRFPIAELKAVLNGEVTADNADEIRRMIMQFLSTQNRNLQHELSNKHLLFSKKRIVRTLITLADLYGNEKRNQVRLIGFSDTDIAAFAAVQKEDVSRTIGSLKEGIILSKKVCDITIGDMEALRRPDELEDHLVNKKGLPLENDRKPGASFITPILALKV